MRTASRWIALSALIGLVAAAAPAAAQTPGVTPTSIKIGNVNPLSGPTAIAGIGQRDGAVLAFEEINAAGGVFGRKIEMVEADDECNPAKGLAGVKRLVSTPVFALTGFYCSAVAATVLEDVDRARIPLVLAGTVTSRTVYPTRKYVFRALGSANSRGMAAARIDHWVKELKPKPTKVGAIFQSDELGVDDFESMKAQLAKYKPGEAFTLVPLPFDRGATDFSAQVLTARKDGVDLLYVNSLPREGGLIMKQTREIGWTVPVWGASGIPTGGFFEAVGDLASGMYYEVIFQYDIDENVPAVNALREKLLKRFGSGPGKPNAKALNGYYSARVIIEAIRRSGENLTREGFVQALESMRNVSVGVGYPATFTPEYHDATNQFALYRVQGSQRVKVGDLGK